MNSTTSRALAAATTAQAGPFFSPDSPSSDPMSTSSSPASISSVSRVCMNGSSSIPSTPRDHGSSEISSPALLSRHFAHHNYTMHGKWKARDSHLRSNKHMEERPTRSGSGIGSIPILNLGQAKAFAGSGSTLSSDNTPSPLSSASSSSSSLLQSPSLQSPSFLHSSSPSLQSPSSSASADWLGSFQFSDTTIIGSTGSIRTGIHETTHAMTTIVMLDKKGQPKGGRHVKNILFQMKTDEHPYLLKLHEVLETWNRFYLIMEYASGGSLISHITSHGALSRDESIRLTAQLVDVIAYQQHRHGTYMDIGNVMLDHEMDIQMMDARIPTMIWADQPTGPKPSHPHCVAPEILTGGTDLSKCDVWNIGILLYLMLTGEMPFGDDAMTMKRLHHGSWIANPIIDSECETLLNLMLNPSPAERPTIIILTQHALFRDHTFAPTAVLSSTSSTQRSLASTPSVSDVMMTDVEEEPENPMERRPSTGVAALQSRLDHLHELAVMSPQQRRISAASVLPSSIFVPQSDPPTPSRSKAPSLTGSPVTHKRSVSLTNAALSQTGSPHSFRRSLPLSNSGSMTNSPREPNRRLSMGPTPSSRTRVVLINESNGDEAIWRPTIVPSPAIPSPQSITVKSQPSMEFTGRAISGDPSPKKLPIDPMYASPRISTRALKAFTPSFRSPETSPHESPVSSRPATPHPIIPASEEPVLMTATPSTELMRPMAQRHEMDSIIPVARHGDMLQEVRPIQRHAEMISELAHLSIDAQQTPVMTPRTQGRTLERGSLTLPTIPPITTVTTPRIQPPPARSSFSSSSTPPAATCPMPSRRLSTIPTITHNDDVHIRIKAQPQHGHLTTSIYHMELQDSLQHVYTKLLHVMNDMGIRYHKDNLPIPSNPHSTNDHIGMECEITSSFSSPTSSSPSHVKFHIDIRHTSNHTMIRMDHVFGSFDGYRHTFNMIRNAMMKDEEKTTP